MQNAHRPQHKAQANGYFNFNLQSVQATAGNLTIYISIFKTPVQNSLKIKKIKYSITVHDERKPKILKKTTKLLHTTQFTNALIQKLLKIP